MIDYSSVTIQSIYEWITHYYITKEFDHEQTIQKIHRTRFND